MSERPSGVQSVDRALRILEYLADEPEGLRLGELATVSGLAPSTVHRLLTALQQRRFVQFSEAAGAWHVGGGAFRVGAAFAKRKAFVAPAMPLMRRLRDETAETINIGEPDDGRVVILVQVESREIVRVINVVGGSVPLSSSALGKSILSTYSDEGFAAHIERHGLPRSTSHTMTSPDALRADLVRVRERGFAIDCEEHFMGLHCVAAPVFDRAGEAVAALSVSGLAARMTPDRVARAGTLVAEAAAELTAGFEGAAPQYWRKK